MVALYINSSHPSPEQQNFVHTMEPLSISPSPRRIVRSLYHCFLEILHANPFFLHLSYFVVVSLLGLLFLEILPMKGPSDAPRPSHLDLLFTSVSAATVSSMTAVEMESFSNSQLLLLTLLMLVGGEVFTSMLSLFFTTTDPRRPQELELEVGNDTCENPIEFNSFRYLRYVVLGYLGLVHATGSSFILAYLSVFHRQKAVLDRRGIRAQTFAVFVAVSSFANCGFVPTNENMIAFRESTGMLLAVAALVLLGNTVYPLGLRFLVGTLAKVMKREEFGFVLSDRRGVLGYEHLMGGPESAMLGATVAGFLLVQVVAFCCLEWRSQGLEGMSTYEKVVGAVFMSVNARHAGESVVDLSAVTSAILVLFVVMMYLPPYTTFLPVVPVEEYSTASNDEKKTSRKNVIVHNILLSQLSYLAIFVIIICITERRCITIDPLNFNVLNIVVEVTSAYGNVGFSTGYSCDRQLRPEKQCKQSWVGFSGKWSKKGKLTLMAVMLFGRLKKFSLTGGKAWKLR